jgi:hypothetical protein
MRVLLAAGTVLVFAAGTQLYVLSAHTARFFAWTIASPLTAAAIGGFYYAAVPMAGLSARQHRWDLARVGVPGILIFLWLTIVASLRHLAVLHLHAHGLPRFAAIAWLVIYIADPPLLLLAYVLQLRRARNDPPRLAPMPWWYRRSCAVLGCPVLVAGVALYAFPGPAGAHWPWRLTPIAAQTIAAWLIALALLLGCVAAEGDAFRCRPASVGMTVLAILQLAALLRYPQTVRWPEAVAWVALVTAAGLAGGYGLLCASRGRRQATAVALPALAAVTRPGEEGAS